MEQRVLVTGAGGQLGHDLVAAFSGAVPPGGRRRALYGPEGPVEVATEVVAADHAALAVDDRTAVLDAVESIRPHVIVHAAAYTAVDACETEPDRAFRVNALGTRHVAEAAARWHAHLVYISTDYVFDGRADRPYTEWDEPHPLSVYGRSKLGGERECPPGSTVVRTSWLCGATGPNMVATILRLAAGGTALRFVDDQRGSPTFTADLAAAVVTLGSDRRPGLYHVTNQGETTWWGFAKAVVAAAGGDPDQVMPIATADLDPPRPAPRPACSVLDNAALRLAGLPALPPWEDGLARLVPLLASGDRVGSR
ncbi:MAG: dTDP-4-dehydrorhamnose reductase [Actinomycetota bacterium]|jgi:dTDP-4-dehydrorhamnose reductase|nr:dTDP-4-dehydrorhamnose reductase [Actinomycetota bacterium]